MKILIFGSCVSRDAFRLDPNGHEVTGFVAKNSLATAFRGKPFPLSLDDLDPEGTLPDNFLRRMLDLNLTGGVPDLLRDRAAGSDVLLIDFVDERLPLIEWDGALATYCMSFRSVLPADNSDLILTRDPRRRDLWIAGLEKLIRLSDKTGVPLLLNKALWAHGMNSGSGADRAFVDANNEYLRGLYEIAENHGIASVDYGDHAFGIDDSHHWGPAPYHYGEETYRLLLDGIDAWASAAHPHGRAPR
ncbi:DUF6270 domain-containing protein [Defluviimonas salinarum]|uniref:DUF6270 domain-containing protein n=1 Tax=Defluviimonas salinarum TaxID=2992147 RepID=A0ABT3J4I4_9RHOB|nr:DUF6270 domain-containing protein [Defluviimonas salinarum]MCW3782580.1 DUF6270 domain-containing protein [Defluviimonas salinarum]